MSQPTISPVKYDPLHSPNNEIRLLTINPRSKEKPVSSPNNLKLEASISVAINSIPSAANPPDPEALDESIICTLSNAPIDHSPPYTALSYNWGSMSTTSPIKINGQQALISHNLAEALRALRKEHDYMTMWVDAICINQTDNEEKSSQVNMMHMIYSRAFSVIAWLGPTTESSSKLMATLESIGKEALDAGILKLSLVETKKIRAAASNPAAAPLEQSLSKIKDLLDGLSARLGTDLTVSWFDSIGDLEQRPYWTRIWVLQEFVAAQKLCIIWGSAQLDFEPFAAAMMFQPWHSLRRLLDPSLKSIVQARTSTGSIYTLIGARRRWRGQVGSAKRDTLFELLVRTCIGHDLALDRRATDADDIVYGLLAMAADREQLDIVIDYSKTPAETYTDAARALLQCGYMSILAWNQHPKKLPGLPSWVPDLSSSISDPCGEPKYNKLYSAAGPASNSYLPTSRPSGMSFHLSDTNPLEGLTVLHLTCYRIDTIEVFGSTWYAENSFNDAATRAYFHDIEILTSMCMVHNPDSLPPLQERRAEAFWRIPSADQFYNGDRTRATHALFDHYFELRALVGKEMTDDDYHNLSQNVRFYWMNLGYQHNRKPFISKKGYIGLIPGDAHEGDLIAVVSGASVPYVFRERDEGKEGWELIGEAYVDGLMDGEAMALDGATAEVLQVH